MGILKNIKTEIERLKATNPNEYNYQNAEGYIWALDDILSFLDTLEEPVSDGLEETAEEYADLNCHNHVENETDWNGLLYAFKAGAEWQKEQDKKTIELAEDHAYFAGGVNEREKMMEEAVDVHIVKSYNPCTEEGKPTPHGVELLYEDEGKPYLVAGENARIIILSKEGEK